MSDHFADIIRGLRSWARAAGGHWEGGTFLVRVPVEDLDEAATALDALRADRDALLRGDVYRTEDGYWRVLRRPAYYPTGPEALAAWAEHGVGDSTRARAEAPATPEGGA